MAPDCSATAVREPLVDTAKPWKNPAATLAVPIPIISWFGSTSSPRRAAKLVDVAIVSVSDTKVMPMAAANSGPTSPMSVHGNGRSGQALRKRPHRGDGQVEDRGHHGRTDHGDEHRRDRSSDAGEHEQDGQRDQAEHQRRRVALVESVEERPHLLDEAVGVGREPAQLGQLADDDGDRQPVHVSDLDLLREQVGDETELRDPEPDQDQPDHDRHHPGERDRPSPDRPATASGAMAAKISGDTDESGPSTSTRDGPMSA